MLDLQKFEEKIKDFLVYLEIEKNLSKNTLRAYKIDLTQILNFWKTSNSLKNNKVINSFDRVIKRFYYSIFYKNLSDTTIARKTSSIKTFLLFLNKSGYKINFNFKKIKLDKKSPEVVSMDEIFYLLDSVENNKLKTKYPYRDKAIFELIYATGIKCSELVDIKISEIDFENKTIAISTNKKTARTVFYGSKAENAIVLYFEKERYSIDKTNSDYLFLNYNGKKLTTRSVQRVFQMFKKCLKLGSKLSAQKIRNSFATHLLNKGVDVRFVKEFLGHKAVSTTENYAKYYSSQVSKFLQDNHPINKLNNLIFDEI